jgi:16S rRNA (cytosine1402-N4)-methyltransferase
MVQPARIEEAPLGETAPHQAVLLEETIGLLAPRPGDKIVDATLGAGGHAEALLEAAGEDGLLVGIDRDPVALEIAGKRLARFSDRFRPIQGNHCDLKRLLDAEGIEAVDRILLDLGISSIQLDDPERGFSFRVDGPLDMRMTPDSGPTAADLLAGIDEARLREILWRYGEERQARRIARAIVQDREQRPFLRTTQLAELVARVAGPGGRQQRIHPATRTFQALRIAVNGEIDGLERLVGDAVMLLRPGGRIAVIAFHSLEDRAVKHAFRDLANRCVCPPRLPVCGCDRRNLLRIETPRPVRPSTDEIQRNPRSRSARLRVAERI